MNDGTGHLSTRRTGVREDRQRMYASDYPTTYLVSKTGEILAVRKGFLHWDTAEVRALLTALMDDEFSAGEPPPDPIVRPVP